MTGRRVLIIEDDPTLSRVLRDNFEFKGCRVATALDGESGLQAARAREADVIILDIMLPKVNGYEVCRLLRSEGLETPIIMLTAKGEEADLLLGLAVGADDYVTKPFSIRELLARAEVMFRHEQATVRKAREYEERLRAFVEQLETHERDLSRAREFQRSLFGRVGPRPGLNTAGVHQFCQRMGGDFYDVLDLGDARTGLLMADVSGHGVQAALVTGMLKVQIAGTECGADPGRFVAELNARLGNVLSCRDQFLTLAYVVVDGSSGEAQYASAGHNPIALLRSDGGIEEFHSSGLPLGMLEELELEVGYFAMEPGDSVWLYTDGLFEPAALNLGGSGRKRLLKTIRDERRGDLDEWADAVFQTCRTAAVGSPHDDDMALLAACRL